MKTIFIAIRDGKSESFGTPQTVRTKAEALRMVQHQVNQPGESNMLHNYPEDFTLYAIGEYDDDTGAIKGYEIPELVAHLKDLKDDTSTPAHRPQGR